MIFLIFIPYFFLIFLCLSSIKVTAPLKEHAIQRQVTADAKLAGEMLTVANQCNL